MTSSIDTRHYHKRNQQVISVRKRGNLPILQVSLEIRPKWGVGNRGRGKIFDRNIRTSNTLTWSNFHFCRNHFLGWKPHFFGACRGPSIIKKPGGTKPTLLSLLRYKSEKVYRESFELRVSECGRPIFLFYPHFWGGWRSNLFLCHAPT